MKTILNKVLSRFEIHRVDQGTGNSLKLVAQLYEFNIIVMMAVPGMNLLQLPEV